MAILLYISHKAGSRLEVRKGEVEGYFEGYRGILLRSGDRILTKIRVPNTWGSLKISISPVEGSRALLSRYLAYLL